MCFVPIPFQNTMLHISILNRDKIIDDLKEEHKPLILRGGIKIEKPENLGRFPNRVDPPPLSDIWDIFEFQTFLKNADYFNVG